LQAFLSDIHGNLEALEAVLEHARNLGVDEFYCLGDVVGYGPNPRSCLKAVSSGFVTCLRGNHEEALLSSAEDFNIQARRAIEWTRDRINSKSFPREENLNLWNFIDGMSEHFLGNGFLLVHGSPRDPVHEYVVPEDVLDGEKMRDLFSLMSVPLCFTGHTHVPGVFLESPCFIPAAELDGGFTLPEGKRAIVNVGSVGQPRDGDPRACYVTMDSGVVMFHRVSYAVAKTCEKIEAAGKLPLFLASRLKEGK